MVMDPVYQDIYRVIKMIPAGRVATYGQISQLAGIGRQPRRVGHALSIIPDNENIPWHRVINAKGEISRRWEMGYVELQHDLLLKEGIFFDKKGRIPLDRFQWRPVSRLTKKSN